MDDFDNKITDNLLNEFKYKMAALIVIVFFLFIFLIRELSDTIMNVVGTFMWVAVGGTALHYWSGYMASNDFTHVATERQVGLAMGALCVINGALYLVDTVLAFIHFSKEQ